MIVTQGLSFLNSELALKLPSRISPRMLTHGLFAWYHGRERSVRAGAAYDLTGKAIIPFATSSGSGIGKTNERLAPSCKDAKLMDGKAFKHNVGHKELAAWVDGLKL